MSVSQGDALVLRLQRFVRAERERVFAAWTEPDQLKRWSAPAGLLVSDGAVDLRPGGGWRATMVEPDGARHEAFGTYLEVSSPVRLVYTHAWRRGGGSTPETIVTVDLESAPGGTRVVLTQEGFETAASRDGHDAGWSSTLDRLVELFAAGASDGVATLRHQVRLTRDVVRLNLSGITHEQSLRQPEPAGNCINWVLGHLVAVYNAGLPLLGQAPVVAEATAARYARGSLPITAAGDAQPLEELQRAWEEACVRFDAGLAALEPARLHQPVPHSPTGDAAETMASLLATVLFHQAYHAGQLGVLRRLTGRPGAIP